MTNILVVDDEPEIRSVVGQVLREAGYGVVTAANGAEALHRIREQPPDGIVLDLNMPVMDGRAFLSACRSDPEYANLPVALFTTAMDDGLIAEDLAVQACIAKPFEVDGLTEVVGQLIPELAGVTGDCQAAPSPPTPWTMTAQPAATPQWLFESMRSQLAALRRQIHATHRAIERGRARVLASNTCLHRASERIEHSRRLVSTPGVPTS